MDLKSDSFLPKMLLFLATHQHLVTDERLSLGLDN